MKQKAKPSRPVNYALYTLGDLSSGIYAVAPGILLMFYMTNILGISVGIATAATVLPKLVDLLASPLVGGLSDRTFTRLGRRRPYILFAGLALLPTFFLIWAAPASSSLVSAIFVALMFSLCSFCFASFLVPYCALNSEIAATYQEGTALTSYRSMYSMLGCLLAGAGAPLVVEQCGGGKAGYLAMGAVMGAIMSLSILTTFFASKEPVRKVATEKISTSQLWLALTHNRPFLILCAVWLLHMLGAGVVTAALAYYVTYVLNQGVEFLSLVFFLSFGSSVLAIPLFLYLGKRMSKYGAFSIALFMSTIAGCGYLFLDASTPVAIVLTVVVLAGMSEGGNQVFSYSMLTDCIRQGDIRADKQPPEALLSGVFIAMERLGLTLGALVTGGLLASGGLIETQEGITQQPGSAVMAITLAASVIPAGLNALSLIMLSFYRRFDQRVAASAVESEPGVEKFISDIAGCSASRP
ncbi:MFS transporter [Pseudomonas sp. FP597]|uniref:MFS transporter n=1 Tax=Pseudomonas lactucae TaxID=2813360 RepID=A0A9X0YAU0_9PSED|nr:MULTISPECIES: MFS transporter [Pseudomonas]MBN2975752.1 MFS transporter [Pseudomonas lactucae]MBN2985922.1 MFS transporter [Pseudomonas lactucae]WLI08870.1 MFS transporter [Pseudomonas sp. FP597]